MPQNERRTRKRINANGTWRNGCKTLSGTMSGPSAGARFCAAKARTVDCAAGGGGDAKKAAPRGTVRRGPARL